MVRFQCLESDSMRPQALANWAVTLGLALLLSSVQAVEAAAPSIILIYGEPLTQPIAIADWDANFQLRRGEPVHIGPAELLDRPYLDIAEFWGAEWYAYVSGGKPLDELQ